MPPIGSDYFCRQTEEKYGLRPGYKRRGQPGKKADQYLIPPTPLCSPLCSDVGIDGRTYSHSTGERIRGRKPTSSHNDRNGNRGADIRSGTFTVEGDNYPDYVDTATDGDLKVLVDPSVVFQTDRLINEKMIKSKPF